MPRLLLSKSLCPRLLKKKKKEGKSLQLYCDSIYRYRNMLLSTWFYSSASEVDVSCEITRVFKSCLCLFRYLKGEFGASVSISKYKI